MIVNTFVVFLLALTLTNAQTSGLSALFPIKKQYVYEIKTNISTGTLIPHESGSYWTLDGKLSVQVFDNYTRARIRLGDLKTSINNGDLEYSIKTDDGQGPAQNRVFDEAAEHLTQPWEVEYQDNGNINDLYVSPDEPLWATNIKRALSINFQLKRGVGTYYNTEPCLYQSYMDCHVVYVSDAQSTNKYNALHILSASSGFSSWMSAPMDFSKAYYSGQNNGQGDYYSGPLDNIGTADRTYKLDEKIGLKSLHLKSVFQHRTGSHILAVITELSLSLARTEVPEEERDKLILVKTGKRYHTRDFSDPTNGIRDYSQTELRAKTYEILLKIVSKGIDVNHIMSNPSKIHSLDLVELLKTLAQLDYHSLHALYADVVLGTSYEIETSKNVFLEVLPHVRTHASAFFVKTLVVDLKQTVEDATLLSIIRKLPFNVANHSQELLDGLEVFTRLGPDFSPDIRHAGILSFSTLIFKAVEARRVTLDYLDTVVVKYFRMYSDCPKDTDKLVWLQGLSNLQYSTDTYMKTIFNSDSFSIHERFWAILATPYFAPSPTGYHPVTWHILMNDTEHIQLRVAALHSFLTSKTRPSELLTIQNYIAGCHNEQLKRFWYTTVNSLERSQNFNDYRVASNYIQFLKHQVTPPESDNYIMTGNHIVGDYDDKSSTGAMMQLMTIGDPVNGSPSFLHFRVKTVNEVMITSDVALFLKIEGLQTFAHRSLARLLALHNEEVRFEKIIDLLTKMSVQIRAPEKVHIEVVLKVHDKTVHATRGSFNQTEFDLWSREKLTKTVQDVLSIGSHINQQVLYYPFQLDATIPTELGTPIRLQTTTVSFSSIRGNLTALSSQGFSWRNDLFVEYQATALTSLSTDGPLLKSESAARVQQTMVARVPVKFDLSIGRAPLSFEIKFKTADLAPGLAIHSRTLNSVDYFTGIGNSSSSHNVVKVGDKGKEKQNVCTTLEDLWDKVENGDQKSLLDLINIRPSSLVLRSLLLLTSPPARSVCLTPSPRPPPLTLKYKVALLEPFRWIGGDVSLKFRSSLEISPLTQSAEVSEVYNVSSIIALEARSRGDDLHLTVEADSHSNSPAVDEMVTLTLDKKHLNESYSEGRIAISSTVDDVLNTYNVKLRYELLPRKAFEVTGTVDRYPPTSILSYLQTANTSVLPDRESTNSTQFKLQIRKLADALRVDASIDGKQTGHTLNGNLDFLLEDWSFMELMRKLGVYYECRFTGFPRGSTQDHSHLKSSNLDVLSQQRQERLVLADCTAAPRFAITVTRDGKLKVYSGDHVFVPSDTLYSINKSTGKEGHPPHSTHCQGSCYFPKNLTIWEFKVTSTKGGDWSIFLRSSGVEILLHGSDVMIYTPSSIMATCCGYCRDSSN